MAGLGFHFPHALNIGTAGPLNGALSSGGIGFAFGAASGALIGVFQWLLLRQFVPRSASWIAAWAVAGGVIHAIGDAAPASIGILPVALASGVALASLLWTAVGRRGVRFEVWEPVVAGAYVVGLLLGLAAQGMAGLPPAAGQLLVVTVIGLTVGPATGGLLMRPAHEPSGL